MHARKRFYLLVLAILALKLVLGLLFSSGYSDALFQPFIAYFLDTGSDPYAHFLSHPGEQGAFPYPPLMLYLLSAFYAPAHWLGGWAAHNLAFKLPLLLADVAMLWVLVRLFPTRKVAVLIFYALSPVLLYSTWLHSQLDVIPTALFLVGMYLLVQRRWWQSALVVAIALSTKLHLVAVLPIVAIYAYRTIGLRRTLQYALVAIGGWLVLAMPFALRAEYWQYLFGDKQPQLLYSTFYRINDLKVYLPVLALLVLSFRFLNYRKVNTDLFYTYLALVFASFVTLITPSPGWYVWMLPFLSLFFVKYYREDRRLPQLYVAVNAAYLLYFLFFHQGETHNLSLAGSPLSLHIADEKLHNLAFTLLLACMSALLYVVYRTGLRSNTVYKKRHSTLIGIGGDSGVGKSTLLNDLKALLGFRMLELEGDADHRWERGNENWKTYTHLDPKANQLHAQADQLRALKYGHTVLRREYDHRTGQFTIPARVESNDFVVLSGLHPFYLPKMRRLIDFKVYLDTDESLRRHWKILRDTAKRGYTMAQILAQIETRMEDAEKHIYPQRSYADLVVRYFPDRDFEVGNPTEQPQLCQQLIFDANIPAEPLLETLYPLPLEWNYLPDLSNQYLTLTAEPTDTDFGAAARRLIPNLEELTDTEPQWQTGYRGMAQLVILYLLSYQMQQED